MLASGNGFVTFFQSALSFIIRKKQMTIPQWTSLGHFLDFNFCNFEIFEFPSNDPSFWSSFIMGRLTIRISQITRKANVKFDLDKKGWVIHWKLMENRRMIKLHAIDCELNFGFIGCFLICILKYIFTQVKI